MPVALSVNINKVALIRNSRGANRPDLLQIARDLEGYGADGITIHPRPDERHVKYADAYALRDAVCTELNIEGYPSERFLQMVHEVKPAQCTLVPDAPGQLTSDHGWDARSRHEELRGIIEPLQELGIRVSIFLDPDPEQVAFAKMSGTDRIELYTGPYAHEYNIDPVRAVKAYQQTAKAALAAGLGLNAGHDLDLANLQHFVDHVPGLQEVSIGHALISDALYFGLSNTVNMYKSRCVPTSI